MGKFKLQSFTLVYILAPDFSLGFPRLKPRVIMFALINIGEIIEGKLLIINVKNPKQKVFSCFRTLVQFTSDLKTLNSSLFTLILKDFISRHHLLRLLIKRNTLARTISSIRHNRCD
jgi:hypothetical protein